VGRFSGQVQQAGLMLASSSLIDIVATPII
jgi:hypothetical protein